MGNSFLEIISYFLKASQEQAYITLPLCYKAEFIVKEIGIHVNQLNKCNNIGYGRKIKLRNQRAQQQQ